LTNTAILSVPKKDNLEGFLAADSVSAGKQRLDPLTSLRFFAAAMIVAYHSFKSFGLDGNGMLSNIALEQGVSCFFVLSGFIMSYAYPKFDGMKDILQFFVARVARMWPAHIATALLTIALLSLHVLQPIGAKSSWVTLANLAMVHGWILTQRCYFSINAPSWSISAEFFFYLCFPFLIYKWGKTGKTKILFAVILVLCSIALATFFASQNTHTSTSAIFNRYLYINPLARIIEFITGMWVFGIYKKMTPSRISKNTDLQFTVLEILAVSAVLMEIVLVPLVVKFCLIHPYKNPFVYWFRYCGGAPLYAQLILALSIGRGAISRILCHPLLVKLGDLSYSVYLLHWIILSVYDSHSSVFVNCPQWLAFIFYSLIVLGLAYLNYTFVETVFRRRILWLGKRALCRLG
jgi:peptidoglycan/LPS O-acetylase OafA/YrhL